MEEIKECIGRTGEVVRLISMQLNELVRSIEQDGVLLIRDYCYDKMEYNDVYKEIQELSAEDLLDLDIIAKELGYVGKSLIDTLVSPRGYRISRKIPRIPSNEI